MKIAITKSLGSAVRERRSIWRLLLPCLALVGRSLAFAQEPAIDASRVPHRMTECEGIDQATCGTWTFTGIKGTGQWSNGAAANLTIQQFDPNWVIIRRTDTSGTSAGLTAIYVGQQNGQRVEGTVKWTWLGHWNQEVQGTWYATFDEPGATASPSRPQESVPQAGQEVRRQAQQPAMPSDGQPGQTEICASRVIQRAMQSIEDEVVGDPSGAVLSLLVSAFTGVNAQSGSATIIGSGNGTDGGRHTAQDPGSFVCTGVFVHGDVSIESWGGGNAVLTAEAMKEIMANQPSFLEWFKVKPLSNGHYTLTLLPSAVPLSQEYVRDFTYSPAHDSQP